ncbi:MAG: CAP domain-containing protein [Burkholderiales bacterium]|nr:CAP domain-containing protein [Burkholderiales bacterium]
MQTARRHRPPSDPCSPDVRDASWRGLRAGSAALLGLLLAACGGGSDVGAAASAALVTPATAATSPTPGTTPTPAGTSTNVDAASALDQLNAARAVARTCGKTPMPAVAPLRWSAALEQAAIGHSEWMQANNTISHTGAGGSSVGTRATAAGYAWKMIGENIAAGQPDLSRVIEAWLASEGHCMNIMHPDFVDVALALKPGTSSNTYRTWWTLDFGRPL